MQNCNYALFPIRVTEYFLLGQLDKIILEIIFKLWNHVTQLKDWNTKKCIFCTIFDPLEYLFWMMDEMNLNIFSKKLDLLQNIGPLTIRNTKKICVTKKYLIIQKMSSSQLWLAVIFFLSSNSSTYFAVLLFWILIQKCKKM